MSVAFERSIFSKNHNYNIFKRFPCSGEHVRRGLDASGGKKTTNRHTHTWDTHTWDNHSTDNNKNYSKR